MTQSAEQYLEDLRISPKPILIFLALAVYAMLIIHPIDLTMFLLLALIPVAWFFLARFRVISRWLTLLLYIATVLFIVRITALPSILIILALVPALAVSMIGTLAGFVIALAVSVVMAFEKHVFGAQFPLDIFFIALLLTWLVFVILYLIYRPILLHHHWIKEYAESNQRYIQEAQSRMVDLNYALFSLANANRNLSAANERMDSLRAIAEDAHKTKTMFLSKVSHEFRTPLNMIIGLVELMAKNPQIYSSAVPPEMENDLNVVLRNCQHLSAMINDVLDLTRIETGQVVLHREWVNLSDLFQETASAVQPLVDKKHLVLQVSIQPNMPELYCDRTRIRQVIFNLVSNAARFTETGGIQIQARAENSKVEVCVTDTGPGILPEDLEHIFEPFFQGSQDIWRGREGSGLGLSISQQFIKLHDGRLWVESEVGRGSKFFFELPIDNGPGFLRPAGQWIRDDWIWREEAFKAGKLQVEQLPNKPRLMVYDQTGELLNDFARFEEQVDMLRIADLSSSSIEQQNFSANVLVVNAENDVKCTQLIRLAREVFPNISVIGCSIIRREHHALELGAAGYLIKPISQQAIETIIHSGGSPVRRMLIIDDDPELQHLFKRMLWVQDSTIEVESAYSGKEGLQKLTTACYDIVFLDIIMQDMDGWNVMEQIKNIDSPKKPPVYIITAQDPVDRPVSSDYIIATISQGISPGKILHGSLEISKLLLGPSR